MRSALSKADGTAGWESSLLPSDSLAVSAEYPFQTEHDTGRGRCLCADEAVFLRPFMRAGSFFTEWPYYAAERKVYMRNIFFRKTSPSCTSFPLLAAFNQTLKQLPPINSLKIEF